MQPAGFDFESFDGVRLHFETLGEGDPVLLLHGFASSLDRNWVRTRITEGLASAGYRAIALDARGHGLSDKPHDRASYASEAMVKDAIALLDHLEVKWVHVVGYSMGAMTALRLAQLDDRPRSLVLGGIGLGITKSDDDRRRQIAEALVAEDFSSASPRAKAFRSFAEATRSDRKALAAIMNAPRTPASELEDVTIPTLVISGGDDTLAGPPQALADAIPNGEAEVVEGDHLNAVVDPRFLKTVLEFLAKQG